MLFTETDPSPSSIVHSKLINQHSPAVVPLVLRQVHRRTAQYRWSQHKVTLCFGVYHRRVKF